MPSVPIAQSRQVAIDRIIEAMVAKYDEELADIADTNLYLPSPEQDAYFDVPQDPDEVIKNHNVAVFIYPAGPRTKQAVGSGGASVGEMQRRLIPLDITVVCRRAMYDPTNQPVQRADGKTLIHDEVLQRRTERYTGAMVATVLSYACGGSSGIIHVDLVDDMPALFFDEQAEKPLWGIGTVNLEITQKVRIPHRRSL